MIDRCQEYSSTLTISIHMLATTAPDGASTHTQSKTHNFTDTTLPTDASTTDKVHASPPLMEDCKETLWLMQRMDPFCKLFLNDYSVAKHPNMKLTH